MKIILEFPYASSYESYLSQYKEVPSGIICLHELNTGEESPISSISSLEGIKNEGKRKGSDKNTT